MSAERIAPPRVERPFLFIFDDEEELELTRHQYAQLAVHFAQELCRECKEKPDGR